MSLRRMATERSLPISLLLFGLLVQACSSETGPTDLLEPTPVTGEILGLVTTDGTPVSGVTVILSRSGSEVATAVTTETGEFGFTDLDTGTYTVAVSEIAGMTCSSQQAATVVAGEETEVAFACVTPASPALVGTVEGRVTVNGVDVPRVLVSLSDAGRHIGSKTTANDGTYRFTNVPTGAKSVWIVTEEPCPGTQQENARRELEVTVHPGGVEVADFACTGQVITGIVTQNGISVSGWKVLVCYGLPVWDYGCAWPSQATDSEGRYAYTSLRRSTLPSGDYVVFVELPPDSDTMCPVRSGVPVSSGVSVRVDLACVVEVETVCNPNWDDC